jgi:hypothetical protein
MFKKLLCLFIIVFFYLQPMYCQCDSVENHVLNNDLIKYSIVTVTPTASNLKKSPMSGRYVELQIPRDCKNLLLKRDSIFWINHLTNEKQDWATNLVLYYLYQKDATGLAYLFDSRSKWLKFKNDDISYWKKIFKQKRKSAIHN